MNRNVESNGGIVVQPFLTPDSFQPLSFTGVQVRHRLAAYLQPARCAHFS